MQTIHIPGYRLGDATLPRSAMTLAEFEELKGSLLLGADDIASLRKAEGVVADQIESILDVWYGFVGNTPHLLKYFSDAKTGEPDAAYLAAVRKRFGQWILDTCHANFDEAWLAWQEEIGRRHHRTGKNKTDGATATTLHIPLRHLIALAVPISVTMKPFLASKGHTSTEIEAMHSAWTKAVLLQAILWSRTYAKDGDF